MNAVCRRFFIVVALCASVCPALMSGTGYKLAIKPSGNTVILSWPNAANNYVLQSSLSLSAQGWAVVTNAASVSNGTNYVTFTNNSKTRFFRLYSSATGFYLNIVRAGTNTMTLSWPAAATNYVLQTSVKLAPASWATITVPSPTTVNGTNFLTYTNDSGTRFFRLYWNTNAAVSTFAGMALIPAGTFTMGNAIGDSDITDASPTSVTVSQFHMDTNLVSYSLWQTVYAWATSAGYTFVDSGSGQGANQPVQAVDWYDAVKWCNARSQQAGLTPVYYTDAGLTLAYTNGETDAVYANWSATGYRLPTEAEWEKAARGGLAGKRFPLGNTISESQANYTGDTEAYSYDLGPDGNNGLFEYNGLPFTSPVGYFAPNGYGLYDMAGNVCQWCWDWYGTPYAGGSDPHGPSSGGNRTLRGGNWVGEANFLRCADRNQGFGASAPNYNYFGTGFRTVRAH
jgi:formylglycine-generating enzyme required for sulfatase activity